MSKTLLEQAIADANSISYAAEEVAKKKLFESLGPEIKRIVNMKLLMEEDDKSAEKLDDEGEVQSSDTIASAPSPEQMISTSQPEAQVSKETPTSEPVNDMPTSASSGIPDSTSMQTASEIPDEMAPAMDLPAADTLPSEQPAGPVNPQSVTTDVPMSNFDDDFTIELKPLIDADGGIQDLPTEDEQPVEEIQQPTSEVDSSLREAFMKRKSIKEALEEIPELTENSEPFSLSDIPEDIPATGRGAMKEDINIYISDSSSDSSEEFEESDDLDFLKDEEKEEGPKMMKDEQAFVEEALKLYRNAKTKKSEKKGKKGSIKEFYKPTEKGFHYGNEDTDPEKDSTLFPIKKDSHFNTVLPPDVKKWMVEAHKTLNIQGKKINEQNVLSHQLRLLVKGLTENKLSKKGFMKLVEALDLAKSIKESNNTFSRFIAEGFDSEEDPIMDSKEDKSEGEKEDVCVSEAQKRNFKRLACIND